MRGDEDLLDIDLLDENVLFNMIDDENQENEADQQQRGGGAIMMKDELGAILEDDDDILNSSTGSVENSILQRSISSCLLYTSPSPRDQRGSRMPSSA